ncbi:hypothetical protein BVG00_22620 [Bacillus cereus]|uniref:ABC transporter ATP-binding protein n=1 Tax=Bacillus cereus TaxID=1396 RepID=UPI00099C63C6|nr:ATP-binding cassette domain-containing protein [Bacillus cereus]NSL61109.1 ATP-binding cassette domain-containing protein [Bacillus cereus]OPD42618.1 hypothetical protein BVG00_22620 [Bacillus cereus]
MIDVRHLSKEYIVHNQNKQSGFLGAVRGMFQREKKKIHALKDVSFQIQKGEVVGYVGTNGSGKSTTIKILTGILRPTSGEVTVQGRDPFKYRKKNAWNIGVVFGQRSQLWWDLPVIDSYELLYRIYGLTQEEFQSNLNYLVEVLEIKDFLYTPVRNLSLGQRIRCEILAAFLHSPEIVILDEPTIGLDIFVKEKIRNMIRKINKERQTTILLTTHDMDDITETCSRILVLSDGVIDYDGSLDEFKKENSELRMMSFDVREKAPNISGISELVENIWVDSHKVRVQFDNREYTPAQLAVKMMETNDVIDLQIEEVNIEDILKKRYGNSSRGEQDESTAKVMVLS